MSMLDAIIAVAKTGNGAVTLAGAACVGVFELCDILAEEGAIPAGAKARVAKVMLEHVDLEGPGTESNGLVRRIIAKAFTSEHPG